MGRKKKNNPQKNQAGNKFQNQGILKMDITSFFPCSVECSLHCPGLYIEEQKAHTSNKNKMETETEIVVLSLTLPFIKIFWKSETN